MKPNKLGFTLIELMVVTAVIAILSSVSIPLFQQYQVKARSVEGKIMLSTIFRSEQSWFAQFDVYSDCLEIMGIEKPASHFYSYGFSFTDTNSQQISVNNGAPANCLNAPIFFQGTKSIGQPSAPDQIQLLSNAGFKNIVSNNGSTFIAAVVGHIDPQFSAFSFNNQQSLVAFKFIFSDAHAINYFISPDSPSFTVSVGSINELGVIENPTNLTWYSELNDGLDF